MATIFDTIVLRGVKHRSTGMTRKKRDALDALMQETLRKAGVHDLKKWGRKAQRPTFPDLSVEQRTAPCGNGFARIGGVKELPADATRFPVGHSHKQGYTPITPGSDPKDLAGNKT